MQFAIDITLKAVYYITIETSKGTQKEEMEMAVTKTWKVYGAEGHRQRESFSESALYDFSENGKTRIIEVLNSDKTGTNEYSIVKITRDTKEECDEEFDGEEKQ